METTRTYTVRLAPLDDLDRRRALVSTHWKINQGVKYFAETLLTFLAGVRPSRIDSLGDHRAESRSLLCLCWLSPESLAGSPAEHRVEPNGIVAELESVLHAHGLSEAEIESWIQDCTPTLTAAIRSDAVWVNRFRAWENLQARWGIRLGAEDIQDFVGRFLSLDQLAQPGKKGSAANSGKPMIQATSTWVSQRFGEGKGRDFHAATEGHALVAGFLAAEGKKWIGHTWGELLSALSVHVFKETPAPDRLRLLARLGHAGIKTGTIFFLRDIESDSPVFDDVLEKWTDKAKSDTEVVRKKCNDKGPRTYSDKIHADLEALTGINVYRLGKSKRSQQKEFCVMLDHAARNLSCIVSWRKNAESQRRRSDQEADILRTLNEKHPEAKAALDRICLQRGRELGVHGDYAIRPQSITTWKRIRESWKNCDTEKERKNKAKFIVFEGNGTGDINLYLALAEDSASVVRADENILYLYAKGTTALQNRQRFKVPSFRHTDPLAHPVFVDFGSSRPGAILAPSGIVRLDLIADDGSLLHKEPFRWQSKRLRRDFGFDSNDTNKSTSGLVPRLDRLGRSLASAPGVHVLPEKWACRLQASRFQLEQVGARIDGHDPYQIDSWPTAARRQLDDVRWFLSASPKMEYPSAWERYCKTRHEMTPENLPGYFRDIPIRFGSLGLLSGLPGLRVLCLHCGERAVSGVVWQVISRQEMNDACNTDGVEQPSASVLYYKVGNKSYRRISANPDCSWARMERSFPIKLQGEDHDHRLSTIQEQKAAKQWFSWCGRVLSPEHHERLKRIDTLLQITMETAKQALIRHADLVRCIHHWSATETMLSGGSVVPIQDAEQKVESIQTAMRIWSHLLRPTSGWIPSSDLSRHWKHFIQPFTSPKDSADFARSLLTDSHTHENVLESLTASWNAENDHLRAVIRGIKGTIFPRRGKQTCGFGGLSFRRIDLIQQWYYLLKSYSTRPTPENAQGKCSDKNFARRTYDYIARLKNERSKQIASHIVEAALGLSSAQGPPRPAHSPCHAVVVENLMEYKPEQDFSNRRIGRLVGQSLKLLRKRLVEHCQLYGLFLVEMIGEHTTRQHALSGEPAMRCAESQTECLNNPRHKTGRWVERLRQKQSSSMTLSSHEEVVLDIADFWRHKPSSSKRKVLLPSPNGPILVSRSGKTVNTDINAAANLGLQTLLDPEWPGAYWKLSCNRNGCIECKKPNKTPLILRALQGYNLTDKADLSLTNQGIINVWRDISTAELETTEWTYSISYWRGVRETIYALLRELGKTE